MKTLYVSDPDGTLLQSNAKISPYTTEVINNLVKQGMQFSYATARSYLTARKVTEGLIAKIPVIVYNGAMVIDNADGSFLLKNFFDESVQELLADLFVHNLYPIVYAFLDNQEKMSFIPEQCTSGMKLFLDSRKGDVRLHPVKSEQQLLWGEIFYISCIDTAEKLVVFGDGKNDIDMFELADECYAVQNAVDELKALATDVIAGNNEDGVARWLAENYHR